MGSIEKAINGISFHITFSIFPVNAVFTARDSCIWDIGKMLFPT